VSLFETLVTSIVISVLAVHGTERILYHWPAYSIESGFSGGNCVYCAAAQISTNHYVPVCRNTVIRCCIAVPSLERFHVS
jgi:hypothetical protein